ncbi:hypothetical protein ACET9Q_13355 [Aeromonas caviae]|uniref:Uncharacterized protein n=2 Tax=Aeromonas caviae TaxID=648 RepID=A0A6M4NRM6_AERCA|nr:hypothetical protein [Aeromonas caviae]MDH1221120.1 hypothetical protein [Aeromonas caviae]QJR99737.1 Hypothetical protein [Aeromonas caviae]QMV81520.1 Hypothetical protein [Aeromonas caviae]QQM77768.1 hypothetical protein JH254_20655 [Aeromonas caviae]QQV21679.1 hypothetical protein JJJ22_21215 [Aeromonas caviae]
MHIDIHDEIDRKALEAMEAAMAIIFEGGLNRAQADALLGVLQTGFNGITTAKLDYGSLLTELSVSVAGTPDWQCVFSRVYRSPAGTLHRLVISNCTLKFAQIGEKSGSDYELEFAVPSEAFRMANHKHNELLKAGYRIGRRQS